MEGIRDLDEQLEAIECWIVEQGLELLYDSAGAEYNPDKKHICYNSRINNQNLVYELLHECGHHICAQTTLLSSNKYVKQRQEAWDGRVIRSMRYRIEILREEFEAWDNGYDLSQELNLEIDFDEYMKVASEYISSYCDWISERDWNRRY